MIIASTIILLSGIFAWVACCKMSNAAAVRRLMTKARQRGEPVTLAEVAARYPAIPDERNAAVALLDVWRKENPRYWNAFLAGVRPLPNSGMSANPQMPILGAKVPRLSRGERISEEALKSAQDYLVSQGDHMEAVRAALVRPRFRAPIKIVDGFDTLLPHLAALKKEALNFRLQALVASEQGDAAAAVGALSDIAQTGALLKEEPLLVSQLVRLACSSLAIEGMEDLLSRQVLAAEQLASLQTTLEQMKCVGALSNAYVTHRATGLGCFDLSGDTLKRLASNGNVSEEDASAFHYEFGLELMKMVGMAAAEQRLLLETFEEVIELAGQDRPSAIAGQRRAFAAAAQAARRFPPKIFSTFFLPAMENVAEKFAALESRRRAATLAIEVERYRLRHAGQLPGQIDALVPLLRNALPLDPFDGESLRYERKDRGFVVYSVGADGRDNHGLERPPKGFAKDFDETFVVNR